MRATVECGLGWLEEHFRPETEDCWLLVPADHPSLDPEVVRQLIQARTANPNCSLVIPTFQGKRGHPTLFTWKHVANIRAFSPGLGLNAYLRHWAVETLEVHVAADVSCDLDTPEDYERLVQIWNR